jgi:O-antigen ligase
MFAEKPVFGFGPGTYQFYYGSFQLRSDLTRISTFTGNKGHAHSEYLNYLSETGLPGLLIFVSLIITVFWRGFSLARKAPETSHGQMALALSCGLLTFFIHGFFNGFLEFDKAAMPVLSFMAAVVYLDIRHKTETRPLQF